MSDHYALEKIAYHRIAEDLKSQEQARLADKLERAQRQTAQASAGLSLRGLLHILTLGAAFLRRRRPVAYAPTSRNQTLLSEVKGE